MRIGNITIAATLTIALAFIACEDKESKEAAKAAIAKAETEKAEAEKAAAEAANTFTDSRDGKEYKIVKIGEQKWMAENLKYAATGTICYNSKTENCDKYGRLYEWKTVKEACPSGWHLPSGADWDILIEFIHKDKNLGKILDPSSPTSPSTKSKQAAKYLKAASSWINNSNGTDNYGFNALQSGSALGVGDFRGGEGIFSVWSSTESGKSRAYAFSMDAYGNRVNWYSNDKTTFSGIRCVKD
jgi:uncharacterized protein (TIGR02145 family)